MKEKESLSFFLPIPYLYTQATTSRMPGLGHTFWFYSFVLWVQREYRARLEISYIDFFFFKGAKVRPVSNFVPLPCRTQLIELNSTLIQHGSSATFETKSCYCRVAQKPCRASRQNLDLISNFVLPPCGTQFINYKIHQNTLKSLLNRFFIFVFCFRQQSFYSTELNSTSETKCASAVLSAAVRSRQSSQLSTAVARRLKQALPFLFFGRVSFKRKTGAVSRWGVKSS